MKNIRIWFNHWFSTAYHIIELIKKEENIKFTIIGSSRNSESVVKMACDEWYEEPDISGDAYIDFCIDFCRTHRIDVFLPRHNQLTVSKYAQKFADEGIKVLIEEYSKASVLNDKSEAYDFFRENNIGNVPEYYIVNNSSDAKKAYAKLTETNSRVCIKRVLDEGASSFRILDSDTPAPFARAGGHIQAEKFFNDMDLVSDCPDFMMMPMLEGNEVSVDCLSTAKGIIMIPRFKTLTRTEIIRYDEEVLSVCRKFYEKMKLQWPCNIQFKYHNSITYFLEVNTRMSGGVQYSCLASGVNIPNIAVNKILGIEKNWELKNEEKKISYIETPLLIE